MKQSVEPTTKQAALKLYQAEINKYLNKYLNQNHITVHFALSLIV